jgi:hypothetical protein
MNKSRLSVILTVESVKQTVTAKRFRGFCVALLGTAALAPPPAFRQNRCMAPTLRLVGFSLVPSHLVEQLSFSAD